ncbi:MAG TPA: TolC family protein [Planctomycetota bacterium]|nr:TolC family protein [Planctomycetota bacterium]
MDARHRPLTLIALAGLGACSSASYVASADEEVDQVLGTATETTLGNRREWIIQPKTEEPAPAEAKEPEAKEPETKEAVKPEAMPETKPEAKAPEAKAPEAKAPEVTQQPEVRPDVKPEAKPEAQKTPPDAPPAADPALPPKPKQDAEIYDLARTLATAVRQNREFLAARESLYRQGLSISLTRFEFGPQFEAAVSYLWPKSEGGVGSHRVGGSLTASQRLPTGGTLSLSSGYNTEWPFGPGLGDTIYSSSVSVSVSQPLLRGAGYDISHEPLTQAERALIYAIRDFENSREDLSIRVARSFFELGSQRKTLVNEDRNYDSAVFDRGKAEALLQVGKNLEKDVFLARRREIDAKDQLISAHAAYDRAVDEFKILLGLPTTSSIDIADQEPPYEAARFEVTSAVAAARHNRLDLITARQNLQDVERSVRIAENALLPDLNLTASAGFAGLSSDYTQSAPDQWNSSVGLTFEVPLQRKSERNAYRSALISLEQARRGLQQQEDRLDLAIRDAVRNLRSLEERIALQEDQIKHEQRAVTVTEIQYEQGKLENRELLEARQAFFNAQNALIRLKVDHFVARLNLLKDMGIFFVDEQGMWR